MAEDQGQNAVHCKVKCPGNPKDCQRIVGLGVDALRVAHQIHNGDRAGQRSAFKDKNHFVGISRHSSA
ncbi:Uncharacterised protein [Vibrio cholerae]|nr:Uncharacterised protein [Vibrio cholerae]